MDFNCVFGDAPLGGYGIYIVLHVAYGRTYVKAVYDDGLLLSRDVSNETVLSGVVEVTEEGNVGMPRCHYMAYLGQHHYRAVLFSYFNYLYMYIYYCFLNLKKKKQKNTSGL